MSVDSVKLNLVEKIAEAVLYEGYMLYPYRASAVKNQQRWNFGVLCPRSYSEQQHGSEAWIMQTQCLVEGGASATLGVKIRFLQIVNRSVGKPVQFLDELPDGDGSELKIVDKLDVGDRTYVPWQEAVEREVTVPPLTSVRLPFRQILSFDFEAYREFEVLRDESGRIAGEIIREWKTLSGVIEIESEARNDELIKITVRIRNLTSYVSPEEQSRADALMYSMVSVHTILTVEDGRFVSLLDPPDNFRSDASGCSNVGTWPVLVGKEGSRDTMLSSPIILYDYPQIAPESPGSLFDGLEIDEILSLRILTMTDDEKQEMRQSDDRTRQILERTENMPPEQFMKMHGALRGLQPSTREAR